MALLIFSSLQYQVILETPVCQASQDLKVMKVSRVHPALLASLAYQLYQVKQTNTLPVLISPLSTLLSSIPLLYLWSCAYLAKVKGKFDYSQFAFHWQPKTNIYEKRA